MNQPKRPLVVMPPVYKLSVGFWRWCKLKEVCVIVPALAHCAGNDFEPTPEGLINRFAALVRPNRIPDGVTPRTDWVRKKIFRYSPDGKAFWGTGVGISHTVPPHTPFSLGIGTPYPEGLFVPEGWVIDTLRAIRLGAVAAGDFGGQLLGFTRPTGGELIHLGGKRTSVIVQDLPRDLR